jgi:hypothetical protein
MNSLIALMKEASKKWIYVAVSVNLSEYYHFKCNKPRSMYVLTYWCVLNEFNSGTEGSLYRESLLFYVDSDWRLRKIPSTKNIFTTTTLSC